MKRIILFIVIIIILLSMSSFAQITLANVDKVGVKNEIILFDPEDFISAFRGANSKLIEIKVSSLPSISQGVLALEGMAVNENQVIPIGDIKKLTYRPALDFSGIIDFVWKGATAQGFSSDSAFVRILITNQTVFQNPGTETIPQTQLQKLEVATQTAEPTATPVVTTTSAPTATPTTTETPTPTATPFVTETPAITETPAPSATPEVTPTPIPVATETPAPTPTPEPPLYADMWNHWAEYSAGKLYKENIWIGERIGEKRYFHPEMNVSRIEFTLLVLSALGDNFDVLNNTDVVFADEEYMPNWVKYPAKKAYELGIIKGSLNNKKLYFNAEESISRVEAVQMISNALVVEPSILDELDFNDNNDIPIWSHHAIKKLISYRLVKGYDDKTFRSYNKITRAQSAEMIWQLKKALMAQTKP